MPSIYEGGDEFPTPEETALELLAQGVTPKQIVAEAEQNIADAEAGIVWVNAIAAEQAGMLDNHVKAQSAAQEAINNAIRGGASQDVIDQAQKLLSDAAFSSTVAGINSGDAKAAAEQHARWARETIANAKRRIAAVKK